MDKKRTMKVLLLIQLLLATVSAQSDASTCRCTPQQKCWPSQSEWTSLNETIDGNLAAVRPIAAVCHEGPEQDAESCEEVTALSTNSTWRAMQPGALQWTNWETWPEHNESCYLDTDPSLPCEQGRVSLYSVKAKSATHIQAGVRFAKQHNLRLAIKNSGHDFLGRSSAPESLQIFTNGMRGIHIVEDFVPAGANASHGQAVTMDAGTSLQEMYAALREKNKIAVRGASHTVGVAGGYIQGGGHSFLGPWKGMASDNALEFTVVTAAGDTVKANDYQNSDLFWALRGGGGSTFGVVVDVTVRTFDDVPIITSSLNISTAIGSPQFWKAMEILHGALPSLSDAGGAGYYYMYTNLSLSENTTVSALYSVLAFPNTTDTALIDNVYAPILESLNATSNLTTQYASKAFPSIGSFIPAVLLPGNQDDLGYNAIVTSRFFSRDLLVSEDGPEKLVSAVRQLNIQPNKAFIGCFVGGGKVADNAETVDSALNPAWRKTLLHASSTKVWASNATEQERLQARQELTEDGSILRGIEDPAGLAAYMNEADVEQPDFQQVFWGDNYPRLYGIKQKWDPSGLFMAKKIVGSEDWDDEGLCQV